VVGVSGHDHREVPDHVQFIYCGLSVSAGDERSRVDDTARVPRRLPRLHPRRLHVGPAPVHVVVLAAPPPPVRSARFDIESSSPRDHVLVSLLALNGLRVSEAIGANTVSVRCPRSKTEGLDVLRKGGKLVTMPLAPQVARAVDLAVGERVEGPIFLGSNRDRLDRHAAGRIVRRVARRAGIGKRVGPHTLRHAFITAALDAGVPLRDVQEAASHADPRTTMRYRGRQSLDRHATYIVATFIAGAAR
jgi:integrase